MGKQGVNSVWPLEDDEGGVRGHVGGEPLEIAAGGVTVAHRDGDDGGAVRTGSAVQPIDGWMLWEFL
jgi:hypothetical protein